MVYADIECFTTKTGKTDGCQPDDWPLHFKKQAHKPSRLCYYIKRFNHESEPVLYSAQSEQDGLDKMFIERLQTDLNKFTMTTDKADKAKADLKHFDSSTVCHIKFKLNSI